MTVEVAVRAQDGKPLMMNILVATAFGSGVGGVSSHICTLQKAIRANGFDVEVFVSDAESFWWKLCAGLRARGDLDRGRIHLTEISTNNVWRKIQPYLRGHKISLVHVHDVLLANRFQNHLDVPVVLTVHGPLSREAVMLGKGSKLFFSYLKKCEQTAYERANAIIAVDSGQRDIIVDEYRIDPQRIHVIYNAVDTIEFSPSASHCETAVPYYLVPRRLVPKNGVRIAIEAMRYLQDINVELWIAGDGSERSHLEDLVKALQVKRVRFLGTVDRHQMISLMDKALGIIVPSVPVEGVVEASSIAALEGMSMAKPVIASNIGGIAEIIKDGETGVLFKPGDAKNLAIHLRTLIGDERYRLQIGERARAHVVRNHSVEVWMRNIIEVYQNALQK